MTLTYLISFFGAPGVGKTTLAERLSKETGFYFFDRDILLKCIYGDERDTPRYNDMAGALTKSSWESAIYNAKNGASNIIESPMRPALQGKRASFFDDALKESQGNFKLSLIYCVAPSEVVLEHMKSRGASRDLPKYDNWEAFENEWLNVPGPIADYEHIRVDTSRPIEYNLAKIRYFSACRT